MIRRIWVSAPCASSIGTGWPRAAGLKPSYTEWHPRPEHAAAGKVLVISPDGREESATIHQDAFIYRIRLAAGQAASHELAEGRGLWLQVISGDVLFNGVALSAGDGASSEQPGGIAIRADSAAEALLFDLR